MTGIAADLGLLVIRVVVGLSFAAHGVNKFIGGGRIEGTGRWFESIGMRPGRMHAMVAATVEVGAGLLFALGLFTSLAAAGIVAVMLVAAYTVHRDGGFFVNANGWEYNLVLAGVAVGGAVAGPGAVSVDQALGTAAPLGGWAGLLIALVGGLAAGATLLAACYRPIAPEIQ
ncbi:DoxX family protein [Rhodococcus koreensis]